MVNKHLLWQNFWFNSLKATIFSFISSSQEASHWLGITFSHLMANKSALKANDNGINSLGAWMHSEQERL